MTENHSHYLDYLDLRSDGRIVLYKRADHQNPKWSVRLKIPGTKGFVVKSAKTADDYEARRFAEDLYYQLEERARRGESIRAPTFKKLFEEWSRVLDTQTPTDKLPHVTANLRRLELWALRFLAPYQVDLLTDTSLVAPLGLPVERDLHFVAEKSLSAYVLEARAKGRITA